VSPGGTRETAACGKRSENKTRVQGLPAQGRGHQKTTSAECQKEKEGKHSKCLVEERGRFRRQGRIAGGR